MDEYRAKPSRCEFLTKRGEMATRRALFSRDAETRGRVAGDGRKQRVCLFHGTGAVITAAAGLCEMKKGALDARPSVKSV